MPELRPSSKLLTPLRHQTSLRLQGGFALVLLVVLVLEGGG
jgi:hypothetical protein